MLERWEAADRDPSLIDDGALNVVVVGGGATGIETVGALAELYRSNFSEDYPAVPQEKARLVLVEAGPALFSMFKEDIRKYTEKVLTTGRRGRARHRGESIEPTRITLASGEVIPAHTLVWGAGLQASPLGSQLGVELQRGGRIPAEPDLSLAGHPEVFPSATSRGSPTRRRTRCCHSSARSRSRPANRRARTSRAAREREDRAVRVQRQGDDGDDRPERRGRAVPRGRTMKGKSASLAWGAVHLALLSTGEDRAKAVVNWTWAGFTHERPGRITVNEDERSSG